MNPWSTIVILRFGLTLPITLLALCAAPVFANDVEPPNIIVILADDLGNGDLGINGSIIRTPNIDRLAEQGVRLTNFYASANVCTPSRAGLLTGRYPIRSGLARGVIEVDSTHGLPQEELTIAEFLKSRNYRTAIVGKWHLGHADGVGPLDNGFEYFFGVHYSNDMRPLALYENGEILADTANQSTLTKQYTQAATRFIEASGREPFFLYMAHTFPHIPLHASDDFRGKSAAGIYGDTVEELDWSVGQLVRVLRKHGLERNTLVIFTSDNGAWFEGSNGDRRGMKGLTWDGGFRVPMIAWWPGRIAAGRVSAGISMNIDIFPTVSELVAPGSTDTIEFDGKDVWPLLGGEKTSPHEVLYLFNDEDIAAVRTQRWKYVTRAFYKTRYIGFEGIRDAMGFDYQLLFDMTQPLPERYSLASNEPDVLQQMQEYWMDGKRIFDPLRTGPAAEVFP